MGCLGRTRILVVGWLCILVITTSGCGTLLRERMVRNSGIQRDDYGLPLIIYRSSHLLTNRMVVMLSGDGGWLDFNDSLAVAFSKAGYHVIGFNSRTYFWHQKTPDQTAADFVLLLKDYCRRWRIRKIILNGYSFGADVLPFIYTRLPDELQGKVEVLELLSPFLSTDFKVYFSDLLNMGGDNRTYKVKEEVAKIKAPIVCFYGEREEPKPLGDIRKRNFLLKLIPGDHHYNGGYHRIISAVTQKALSRDMNNLASAK